MRLFSLFRSKKTAASFLPPLSLRNTLSGETIEFVPLSRGKVKMYNCGPTVYDRQHIGNLRPPVVFNVLRRMLNYWGYNVTQVTNLTDFGHLSSDEDEGEDKMSAGLRREGMELSLENMRSLAERYAEMYFNDVRSLGVDTEKVTYPRASDYIPEQIALIQTLIEKGYAYKTKSGVYFEVSRFPRYGKLGGINLSGLKKGARVKESAEKRGPHDFILWKSDKHLGWDSPWGKGFPGWHIECTAMIFKLLGRQIDIHTGGIEHIPVHHNNEIAQAESASGKRFVKYWLHNDHITIEGKKISKSLGNTVYLHNITDRGFSPLSLRYWLLTAHYRSPANFTWEALEGAHTARERLLKFFFVDLAGAEGGAPDPGFMREFTAALARDLDTPQAIARVWDLVRSETISKSAQRASLLEADKLLGLGLGDRREMSKLAVVPARELPDDVQKLVAERDAARAAGEYVKADELRANIESRGYELKDTSTGTQAIKK